MSKGSKMPQHLKLESAEAVVANVKKALANSELLEDMSISHSEEMGPSPLLRNAKLTSEKFPDYESFLSPFWAKAAGRKSDGFFVARNDAPSCLKLRTSNRMAFVKDVPLVIAAFDKEKIAIDDINLSWYWDSARPRANGHSTHRTVYELVLSLDSGTSFSASKWLKKGLDSVCASDDARADENPFQAVEDIGQKVTFMSYEYTKKGLVLEFESEKVARKVIEKIYADCYPVYTKAKDPDNSIVTLTFPDML
jgi:hypothetical protein